MIIINGIYGVRVLVGMVVGGPCPPSASVCWDFSVGRCHIPIVSSDPAIASTNKAEAKRVVKIGIRHMIAVRHFGIFCITPICRHF
jgi:hypothetical protein